MSRARPLRAVLGLFLRERPLALAGGGLLAAATVLSGIALLGISGWFITATALAGLTTAGAAVFNVFTPSAGIRLFALTRSVARYGERLVTHDATLGVLAGLRERLFRGWAAPGAARELALRPARLLFRLTGDIDALDSLYLRILVPMGAALAAALAVGLVLGGLGLWLGIGAALWLAVAGLGLPLLAARLSRKAQRRRAHAMEALRARAVDLVAGQSELAMAGRLGAQRGTVMAADTRLAAADDALNRVETGIGAGFGIASALLVAATLLAVAALAQAGAIDAPAAMLGVTVALAALEPFAALRRGALEIGRTLLAVRRIGPRLAPQPEPAAPALPPAPLAVRLAATEVRHAGAARPVLSGASLRVDSGEHVALVGPSGAGKSTLLALIAGEIAPSEGRVEARPGTLLTQRTELFEDSLADNLRLADPAADDARLIEALVAAGLPVVGPDADTATADGGVRPLLLPRGLDTRLGEGGLGLSGGQKRRLALARLFLRDTPLWLLDEPTEGLDGPTARDVMARLKARAEGRTLLIATHIRREAAIADRLVRIEGGRIIGEARRGEAAFDALLASLRPD
ncbi:amino acid ABC transporter ATP-binding/permease protein [Ancylobacter terrae]|uniref:amino acid ABC transporter ATP-binding/permease protein n=1 Tax=Ancylobacter sp. sgz301288 TaxID=3342077 RepID=UPI00385DBB7C